LPGDGLANPDPRGRLDRRDNMLRQGSGNATGGGQAPSIPDRPSLRNQQLPLGNPAVPRTESVPPASNLPDVGGSESQRRTIRDFRNPSSGQSTVPGAGPAQPSLDSQRSRSSREAMPRIQQDSRSFQQVPQRYRLDSGESGRSRYQPPTPSDQPGTPSIRSGRSELRGNDSPAPRIERSFERSSGDRVERSSGGDYKRTGGRSERGRGRGDDD
jgi:hypothetical protein